MQAQPALSRSILRSVWRRARALEHKVNHAAQDLTWFASTSIKDSEFMTLANQPCPRQALVRVFFRGLLQPICSMPCHAESQRYSNLRHDLHIQHKIAKVESNGEGCAHQITRLLGERMLKDRHGADSSAYQDVAFSLMREMNDRKDVISKIQAKLCEQSLAHARLNEDREVGVVSQPVRYGKL
eukprot:gnl/MRDRNA2_/MRDRNA2_180743_c0_seq1.p1 gnl/MRDRNA2_/MRDRNA2_180743_c0~~gnl/MRDRNA2_/MRDRNA2_180743_c0_seq1.p1  ORF type:complete len:184 (+),score=21.87 gnl/MRDRNA2_/MRDRNA2_180743_c0_seq1:54-605(+)